MPQMSFCPPTLYVNTTSPPTCALCPQVESYVQLADRLAPLSVTLLIVLVLIAVCTAVLARLDRRPWRNGCAQAKAFVVAAVRSFMFVVSSAHGMSQFVPLFVRRILVQVGLVASVTYSAASPPQCVAPGPLLEYSMLLQLARIGLLSVCICGILLPAVYYLGSRGWSTFESLYNALDTVAKAAAQTIFDTISILLVYAFTGAGYVSDWQYVQMTVFQYLTIVQDGAQLPTELQPYYSQLCYCVQEVLQVPQPAQCAGVVQLQLSETITVAVLTANPYIAYDDGDTAAIGALSSWLWILFGIYLLIVTAVNSQLIFRLVPGETPSLCMRVWEMCWLMFPPLLGCSPAVTSWCVCCSRRQNWRDGRRRLEGLALHPTMKHWFEDYKPALWQLKLTDLCLLFLFAYLAPQDTTAGIMTIVVVYGGMAFWNHIAASTCASAETYAVDHVWYAPVAFTTASATLWIAASRLATEESGTTSAASEALTVLAFISCALILPVNIGSFVLTLRWVALLEHIQLRLYAKAMNIDLQELLDRDVFLPRHVTLEVREQLRVEAGKAALQRRFTFCCTRNAAELAEQISGPLEGDIELLARIINPQLQALLHNHDRDDGAEGREEQERQDASAIPIDIALAVPSDQQPAQGLLFIRAPAMREVPGIDEARRVILRPGTQNHRP